MTEYNLNRRIIDVYRGIHRYTPLLRWRVKYRYWSYQKIGYNALADPWKTINVSPKRINAYRGGYSWETGGVRFHRDLHVGKLQGGDWDIDNDTIPIQLNKKYNATVEHFSKNTPWKETGIFDQLESLIEKRGVVDGCYNKSDLVSRYEKIDQLYNNIKNHGYKSQVELKDHCTRHPSFNEVCVNIGRDGELIFGGGGGTHRLAIAEVLDLDQIPVGVIVRHKQWQLEREKAQEHPNSIDEHPDLIDI